MNSLQTRPILSIIRILKGLSDQDLNAIQDKARWKRVPAGHELIRHMGAARTVYFLCEGKMRARVVSTSGREVGIRMMETGDTIGEMAVVAEMPRNSDVIAETECVVAEMDADVFLGFLNTYPAIVMNLLSYTIVSISEANDRITELCATNVRDRINAEILRLATRAKASSANPDDDEQVFVINPAPSHERLASFVGTTREAVTKQLSQLSKDGLIRSKRGEIVVEDYRALKDMVSQYVGEGASWHKNGLA